MRRALTDLVTLLSPPDVTSCETGYTSATQTFPGYPGYQDSSLQDWQAGEVLSICLRQRLAGGSWAPWQFFTGTVVKAFRLNSGNTLLGPRPAEASQTRNRFEA